MSSFIPESLLESYASSGFAQSSSKRAYEVGPQPALVIVDICSAYLTPGSSLYTPDRFAAALVKAEELITLFRRLQLPIVFTKIVYRTPEDAGVWSQKAPGAISHFVGNNPMGNFPPTSSICRPDPTRDVEIVIEKQYPSSFFGTPLASRLNAMRVDTTVICGFSTSGCVRATTLDAMQYGFRPFVVGEACGDRHQWVQEANLFDLQAKYAEVVSVAKLTDLLQKRK
ncbi:nicotinamidase-like amidase [Xylogone sp. PMI_703]|nr:nicotinamidase-like amidase [Xylogone sp. PMI_703]